MTRFASFARKLPGIDSPRAVASAKLFLVGARSLDNETAETIARRYRLSAAKAERMLARARERRARRG